MRLQARSSDKLASVLIDRVMELRPSQVYDVVLAMSQLIIPYMNYIEK